jgi:DNA-binding MarR family transcriptional regulator
MREQYQTGSLPYVFQLIGAVDKKLMHMQRQTTRLAGLTPAQFFVLTLLWERDGLAFKDLATAAQCTRATMTGIVDTLERKGLVRREPNPADRRSLLVMLTGPGGAIKKDVPDPGTVFKNCCMGLEPPEIQELGRLLLKLDASLDHA